MTEREIAARMAYLKSEEGRQQTQREIAAFLYGIAVYSDWPDIDPHDLIEQEAKAADELRKRNGRPRPPHFDRLRG
jgi:hypothetical protein